MFKHIYPSFAKGRILKREMLENLRDYPRHLVDILYQDYSDGIIAGADVLVSHDGLTITKGIVKHQGKLYVLDQAIDLPYYATGKETVLKIRFQEEMTTPDYVEASADIVFAEDVQIQPNEQELARFKLKEGARLRSDYQSLSDFATEYNTINIIHVPYAGIKTSTISPHILKYFANEVMKTGTSDAFDIFFAMQCMSEGTVERTVILHYIAYKLTADYQPYSNEQIHKYLAQILRDIKSGRKGKTEFRRGPSRMIVD